MFMRVRISLLILFVVLLLEGCVGSIWPQIIGSKTANLSKGVSQLRVVPPHNITLMLPLKGKGELALTSQAIRNGFLVAYDYSREQQPGVNIKVVDTTSGDVSDLYQQAIADGADVIVGPLTKQEVESIANTNPLPVPTIALNTLDDYMHNFRGNLYQFGLSPLDETMQVAVKMAQKQFDHIAVIAPQSTWGEKIATVFKNRYESFGGRVVATLNYHFSQDLAEQICNFLANDAAKFCGAQKHKKQNSYEPMRRQDIEAIFFVATTPKQARQIIPLLKFYYASDLPIYSISTVYGGASRPDLDQDINDIYFCDMPWVLENPDFFGANLQAIYNQIIAIPLWADSFAKYRKFYALGIDAYNLAVGLNELLNAPLGGFRGATGVLYLDKFNHIYRGLQWAQMKNSKIEPRS